MLCGLAGASSETCKCSFRTHNNPSEIALRRQARHCGAFIREGHDMKTFIKMLRDESGASAAEYALILAIIGAGIAIASFALGEAISNAMGTASDCIESAPGQGCQAAAA